MTAKILLIGKSESTTAPLSQTLEKRGYRVRVTHNNRKAARLTRAEMPDVIVVDGRSSGIDGRKTCQMMRRKFERVPILCIVDKGGTTSEIDADDHLVAPVTSRKLIGRIKKLLQIKRQRFLRVGGLTLDLDRRRVSRGDKEHKLTPKEFSLLRLLMSNPGQLLSRKVLMNKVWETDYMGDTRTLDVHVRWVREKIEENPSAPVYLRTVRGVGYRFDAPGQGPGEESE